MMTIGEFALNTGLSVKALRFYDERGVLTPATVDPHNGYRSYSARQLRDASTVRVLRAAGVGVDRVAQALAEPDLIDSVLADRRREVAEQRAREDRALALGARLGELREPAEVGTREAPATHWAAVVVEVDVTAVDQVDDDAVDEGCEALGTVLAAAETQAPCRLHSSAISTKKASSVSPMDVSRPSEILVGVVGMCTPGGSQKSVATAVIPPHRWCSQHCPIYVGFAQDPAHTRTASAAPTRFR